MKNDGRLASRGGEPAANPSRSESSAYEHFTDAVVLAEPVALLFGFR
jgi:hypothetical protein